MRKQKNVKWTVGEWRGIGRRGGLGFGIGYERCFWRRRHLSELRIEN